MICAINILANLIKFNFAYEGYIPADFHFILFLLGHLLFKDGVKERMKMLDKTDVLKHVKWI